VNLIPIFIIFFCGGWFGAFSFWYFVGGRLFAGFIHATVSLLFAGVGMWRFSLLMGWG
jgi:hypothetical protein